MAQQDASVLAGYLHQSPAGRAGHFYIARLTDGSLKFGSTAKMTPDTRMVALAKEIGSKCKLILAASVQDAGAYEAMMLEAYREHWIGGERFRDFLANDLPASP
jgi:hypothetical protein